MTWKGGGLLLLPNGLPKSGFETIIMEETISGRKGEIVFNRTYQADNNKPIDRYFIATEDFQDQDLDDLKDPDSVIFKEVSLLVTEQGSVWADNITYSSGQIVYHDGAYYRAMKDDPPFLFVEDELGNVVGEEYVTPDKDFYTNEKGETVKKTHIGLNFQMKET